jgi:hypothetical protein
MHHRHAEGRLGLRLVLAAASLLLCVLAMAFGAAAAQAAGVGCVLSKNTVEYGQSVTVSGTIDPVAADQSVMISLDGVDVASATTDAEGKYAVSFAPTKGGAVTARLADDTTSAPASLTVLPLASLKVTHVAFWSSVTLRVAISPQTYTGPIAVQIQHRGRTVAAIQCAASGATTVIRVPVVGVGHFVVKASLGAWEGLAARDLTAGYNVYAPRLVAGTRRPQVKVVLRALAALRFRVPGISTTMSVAATDAVVAFQKAYGLPRTYVWDADDWRKLETAKILRPRYKKPALHIEIDKSRQILMVVNNGAPLGILAVSTGATGNTPEGTHHIMWKAYGASTPYGPGLLYWDMQFYPGFAMHAYPYVPAYPASHGCVRQPTWVAPWTYSVSSVGETVYVYR